MAEPDLPLLPSSGQTTRDRTSGGDLQRPVPVGDTMLSREARRGAKALSVKTDRACPFSLLARARARSRQRRPNRASCGSCDLGDSPSRGPSTVTMEEPWEGQACRVVEIGEVMTHRRLGRRGRSPPRLASRDWCEHLYADSPRREKGHEVLEHWKRVPPAIGIEQRQPTRTQCRTSIWRLNSRHTRPTPTGTWSASAGWRRSRIQTARGCTTVRWSKYFSATSLPALPMRPVSRWMLLGCM